MSEIEALESTKVGRWVARVQKGPETAATRTEMHLRVMRQAQQWADACGHDFDAAADVCGPRGDLFFALQAHRRQLCSGLHWLHVSEGCARMRGGWAAVFANYKFE